MPAPKVGEEVIVQWDDENPHLNGNKVKVVGVRTDTPPYWIDVEFEGETYPVRGSEVRPVRSPRQAKKPILTRESQESLWKLADALARGLRDPAGDTQGDARWTVAGIANSVWEIRHPDIEGEEAADSPLRMRIKQTAPGKWAIFGQNNLRNLQNTSAIHITEDPVEDWNFEEIAKAAAVYFRDQLEQIQMTKEDLQPDLEPGAVGPAAPEEEGGLGGEMGAPPPMASRAAATIQNLEFAQRAEKFLHKRYAKQFWCDGIRVINDRYGIALRILAKKKVRIAGKVPVKIGKIPIILERVDWYRTA